MQSESVSIENEAFNGNNICRFKRSLRFKRADTTRLSLSEDTTRPYKTMLHLLLIVCTVVPSHSWGRDAHEIIATMASHYLTDTAATKVSALLHGANMSSVANWADEVHYSPEYSWSEPIHFTNVQDSSKECLTSHGYGRCTFDYERDCVDSDGNKDFCNAGAIANFSSQILESKGAVNNATTDALKFVIHFVADIHQPLHVGMAGDRGGVKMNVDFTVPEQVT